MNEHRMVLGYTTNDDGIWLTCTCRWDKNLGYSPSPAQVLQAQTEHLACVSAEAVESVEARKAGKR